MKTNILATEIATLERKIEDTKSAVVKKTLRVRLATLKKQYSDAKDSSKTKNDILSKAKVKVEEMTKKDFNEYIKKLSKNDEYKFLGLMTKEEIIDDIKEVAKPVGWRFRGNNNRVPSKKQVTLGRKSGDVYYENRSNHSDVSRVVRLEDGGRVEGMELMGGQPNKEAKPSGATLVKVIGKGKEIIVSYDGGKTKEVYAKSNGYSGYTLRYKGNEYEFVSSYANGGGLADVPNGEVMLDSEHYAKGGNVVSIAKKVAEVNALIERANELGLKIVNENITWQSPMKYKPFKYSNGVLYEEYEELDLYKANRGKGVVWKTFKNKTLKANMQYDNPLNEVAKMYRKALKHYDTYGYANGGEMAKGGNLGEPHRTNTK